MQGEPHSAAKVALRKWLHYAPLWHWPCAGSSSDVIYTEPGLSVGLSLIAHSTLCVTPEADPHTNYA